LISTTIRQAVQQVAGLGVVALDVARIAAALADHLAAVQEHVRDGHRLVEQAAGIVAQVEDQPLHIGVLGLQVGDRRGQGVGGLLVEAGQADIAVVAFQRAMAALGLITSRVSLTSNGSVLSRAMVRVTPSPALPRICLTASLTVRPRTAGR
jgi:hypothetical protein